jgi:hypothetical protein
MGGSSFPRAFERKVEFILIGRTLIEIFERHVTEGSGNSSSVHRVLGWEI